MGIISINGLKVRAKHGVYDQERKVGNDFVVTLRLNVPGSDAAMDSDSLADTINYADAAEIIKAEMDIPSSLIEHVAGRIRRSLLARFPGQIAGGELTVAKLAPPIHAELDSVSFTTCWGECQ